MPTPIAQVDAFSDRPFGGNPAAVCVLAEFPPDAWMQRVAREMNLSETAFLVPERDEYRLRWFTPAVEVDLCGHATLAAAHVLWEDRRLDPGASARFRTRSGLLCARRSREWIELDFPALPDEPTRDFPALAAALGAEATYVGRSRHDAIVELASEAEVRALAPDLRAIRALDVRGVIVTSRAERGPFDFVSRFFAPAAGVDEDPVTGSAHCCLGPYWQRRLGKSELVGFQASARGGVVRVRVAGDRAILGGRAVTVLRGEILDAAAPE